MEQNGRRSVNTRFTDKYDKSMLLYPQISPTVSLHPCQGMDAMASTRWVSLGTRTLFSFFLLLLTAIQCGSPLQQ